MPRDEPGWFDKIAASRRNDSRSSEPSAGGRICIGQLEYEKQRKHGGVPLSAIGAPVRSASSDQRSRRHSGPGACERPSGAPVVGATSSRSTPLMTRDSISPVAIRCLRSSSAESCGSGVTYAYMALSTQVLASQPSTLNPVYPLCPYSATASRSQLVASSLPTRCIGQVCLLLLVLAAPALYWTAQSGPRMPPDEEREKCRSETFA